MKKILVLLILALIFSCSNKKNIVIFDEFYSVLNPVSDSLNYKYEVTTLNDFQIGRLDGFSTAVVSPMIYKKYSDIMNEYNGVVYILEWEDNIKSDRHQSVIIDNSDVYKEIKDLIIAEKIVLSERNLGIIVDSITVQDQKELELISELFKNDFELTIFSITDKTNRSSLKEYIEINDRVELWIVNSSYLGLYTYELLKPDSMVIINNGIHLLDKDRNVIYSIEKNLEIKLDEIFNKKSFVISSELKKY